MNDQSRNLEDLLLDDSYVRWVRGLADEQENIFWENWIKKEPQNKKLAKKAEEVLQSMNFKRVDTSDVEEELKKLNAHIDSGAPVHQQSRPGYYSNNFFRYVAAAAVALVIFSSSFFVLDQWYGVSSDQAADLSVQTTINEQVLMANASQENQTDTSSETGKISTDFAEKKTLIFDDGSKVVLNAKSSLQYPSGNTANGDITVQLAGEAYFDIAERKDKNERTFTVRTENGSVKVLGTKFSVQADEEQTEVALKEGVVEVEREGNRENVKYTMKPGELAQVSKLKSSIKVGNINPAIYFSWTQNEFRFDNTSLEKIAQRIERTYGVTVYVSNRAILDKRISGSIQNNDLDLFLDALSELLQTPIKRTKSTITIGS